MPLLKPEAAPETSHIKTKFKTDTLKEIDAYIVWANLGGRDEFLEKAAQLVFGKDSDWKKTRKTQKSTSASA